MCSEMLCKTKCTHHLKLHFEQVIVPTNFEMCSRVMRKMEKFSPKDLNRKFFVVNDNNQLFSVLKFLKQHFVGAYLSAKQCECDSKKYCKCSLHHISNLMCFLTEHPPCSTSSDKILAQCLNNLLINFEPQYSPIFLTYYSTSCLPSEIKKRAMSFQKNGKVKIIHIFVINKTELDDTEFYNGLIQDSAVTDFSNQITQ